jgi:hypothetical protein
MAVSFPPMGKRKAGGSNFVVKCICASIAIHCGSKGSGTLHTAKQSKSSYLKTVEMYIHIEIYGLESQEAKFRGNAYAFLFKSQNEGSQFADLRKGVKCVTSELEMSTCDATLSLAAMPLIQA